MLFHSFQNIAQVYGQKHEFGHFWGGIILSIGPINPRKRTGIYTLRYSDSIWQKSFQLILAWQFKSVNNNIYAASLYSAYEMANMLLFI